jgi:ABC-type Fe3+ transport system substrate-binding protein
MGAAACAPAAPSSPPTAAPAQAASTAFEQLIAQAKQEPVIDLVIASSAVRSAPQIVDAFKKRFGLNNLKVNADVKGDETARFQQAIAETKAGAKPTFDLMQGEVENVVLLSAEGGTIEVVNWEALLGEVNPAVRSGQVKPTQVSPPKIAGRGFIWATRTKALIYNTSLIKKEDLPLARKDLADPKWAGKLAIAPFTSDWQYGVLFNDKQEWLQIADKVGKNSVAVLSYDAQRDRMLLGEFPLSPSNSYYYFGVRATDKNAPIGVHFFTDYTAVPPVVYTVRKGGKAPASATLFALWSTTPEFEALHQTETSYTNAVFGQSQLDDDERKLVQSSGSRLVTWLDSDETIKTLDWFATAEGRTYNEQMNRALTQRK